MDFISFFEAQIKIQQQALRFFKWWIFALLFAGIGIYLFAFLIDIKKGLVGEFTKLGGVFIAALATIPIKEIPSRRGKIITYNFLKEGFEKITNKRTKEYKFYLDFVAEIMKEIVKT